MVSRWDVSPIVGAPIWPIFASREEIAKAVDHALDMLLESTTIVSVEGLPWERRLGVVQLGPTAQIIAGAQQDPPVFKDAVVHTLMERMGVTVVLECFLRRDKPVVTHYHISAKAIDLRSLAEAFQKMDSLHNVRLGYENIYWNPKWAAGYRYDWIALPYTGAVHSNLCSIDCRESGVPSIDQVVEILRKTTLVRAG